MVQEKHSVVTRRQKLVGAQLGRGGKAKVSCCTVHSTAAGGQCGLSKNDGSNHLELSSHSSPPAKHGLCSTQTALKTWRICCDHAGRQVLRRDEQAGVAAQRPATRSGADGAHTPCPTPPAPHPQPPNHTHTQPHPACPQLPGSLLSSSFPRRAVVSAAAVHSPVRLTAGCHAWVALQDIYNTTIDALKRSQAYETVRTEEMINPV